MAAAAAVAATVPAVVLVAYVVVPAVNADASTDIKQSCWCPCLELQWYLLPDGESGLMLICFILEYSMGKFSIDDKNLNDNCSSMRFKTAALPLMIRSCEYVRSLT